MLTALSCMTHVPALAERCAAASSFGALFAILENFCNMAGFRWFSLYYRSDGGTADSLTNFTLPNLSRWMFDQFGGSSPIGVAADGCATSVAWHEIAGAISLTSRQSKVLEEFERHGIRHGVTVPVRVPGDRGALISFATDDPARLSQDARYAAELLASHVFQAARRIENRDGNRKRLGKGMLTGRQVECLKLIAQGKSDWEAGRILGLSDQTVHDHVETVRRRYGVRRRIQLVIHALHDGLLSFPDVI